MFLKLWRRMRIDVPAARGLKRNFDERMQPQASPIRVRGYGGVIQTAQGPRGPVPATKKNLECRGRRAPPKDSEPFT